MFDIFLFSFMNLKTIFINKIQTYMKNLQKICDSKTKNRKYIRDVLEFQEKLQKKISSFSICKI